MAEQKIEPKDNKAAKNAEELAKLEEEVANTPEPEEEQQEEQAPSSEEESEASDTESATEEPKPTEDEAKPEEEVATETEGEDLSEDEIKRLSAKAQKRIKQLADRAKAAEAELERKNKSLETKIELDEEEPATGDSNGYKLPWEQNQETDDASETLTEAELQQRIEKTADEKVQQRLAEQRFRDNLKADLAKVEETYPELNPDTEDFDEQLADKISKRYKQLHRIDKDLRLADYVEEVMSLKKRGVEQGQSTVTAKVAKQAAEQAHTGSGAPAKSTSVEDVINKASNWEELDAAEKLLS